jgi:NADPH:quinone reductase-like Zn-dependent oxidoreductase
VDAVLDVAGKTPLAELVSLVPEPSQVVTIANFGVGDSGVRLTTGGEGDPKAAMVEAARLLEQNDVVIKVQTFPLDRAAEAYAIAGQGHMRGKLVLLP